MNCSRKDINTESFPPLNRRSGSCCCKSCMEGTPRRRKTNAKLENIENWISTSVVMLPLVDGCVRIKNFPTTSRTTVCQHPFPCFRLHPLLCIDAVFFYVVFAEISLVLLETTRRGRRKLCSLYIYTGLQAVLVLMIQLHTNQVLSVSWTALDCLSFQPFANGGSQIKLQAGVCACKIIYLTQVCSTNRLGGKRLECHANRVNCSYTQITSTHTAGCSSEWWPGTTVWSGVMLVLSHANFAPVPAGLLKSPCFCWAARFVPYIYFFWPPSVLSVGPPPSDKTNMFGSY